PAREARPDRDARRLRHDELRRLHGARGRHPDQVLHALRRAGRRPRSEDGRGLEGRRAASDPSRLQGRARPAVRLLHAGDDARDLGAARRESGSHGGGDPLGALREHLPLHGLSEHRQSGAMGREEHEGVGMSSATETEHGGWLGRSVKRKEDDRFIVGRGNYIEDIKLSNMLYMAILRSPFAHAKINSIDTSRASALPGVVVVVTGDILAEHKLAWMPTLSGDTQAVLATDKVRMQGQEVACVIAEDPYIAHDALDLIEVDYEPLPVVTTPQAALADGAPLIRDDKEGQADNKIYHWEAGDAEATEKAFVEADKVVRLVTHYPRCHPAPLECCGCVADVNPATGKATIYMTSQAPHAHRTVFALVAGLPEQHIQIISPDI